MTSFLYFCAGNIKTNMSNTLSQEKESIIVSDNNLYNFSRSLIINSRKVVYQAANFAMVETYWKIGEKIVEEQGGAERSKYGDRLIASLSKKLTVEFGNGFTPRNLRAIAAILFAVSKMARSACRIKLDSLPFTSSCWKSESPWRLHERSRQ